MTVQKSILGNSWVERPHDERLALALQQKFDLNDILAKIVSAKDVSFDEVEDYLDPRLKTALPDPFSLLDMDIAVDHLVAALENDKKITIFADYDVDGATSSALLKRFFAMMGVEVGIYVPDRVLEGYGPNVKALLDLKKGGTDLVITVDCGTVAFEPLEEAHKAGLDIIVIDHHIGVLEKPKALAVINPNRIDESFEHKNVCAATVSFLFAVAVNKRLRELGFYGDFALKSEASTLLQGENNKHGGSKSTGDSGRGLFGKGPKKEPNLMSLLDLVALGTVCDVMPLKGVNRALVAQGLKILRQRKNIGLRALCDVANLDEEPAAYHLGFVLGPRINAGGRVGKSDLGANLLSTEDEEEAVKIASRLNEFNARRKDLELAVLQEAQDNLEKGKDGFTAKDEVIFAVSQGWHQGVIGIVASRLKDIYGKPVAVIALDEGKGKASCRSITGIDFGGAILSAKMKGLLVEGGGHAMAGGFSVKEDKIADLHKFFQEIMAEKVKKLLEESRREYDLAVDLENVNLELIKSLQKLEPYGTGNKRPRFLLKNVRKMNGKLIGKDQSHISCNFSALSGVGFAGNLQAVAFRSADTPLAGVLLDAKFKKPLSLVGDLNINSYMGVDKVQMIIEDVVV